MTERMKKTAGGLLLAGVILLGTGCGGQTAGLVQREEPTEAAQTEAPTETVNKDEVETLSTVLLAGELYTLDQYPNLKSVDLSGSDCYEAILHYIETHPQVAVSYSVDLGGMQVSSKADSVVLEPQSFQYEALMENLCYLPKLMTISFPGVCLTTEQIADFLGKYPEITLDYTVDLFGSVYDQNTTALDLSGLNSSQVDEAIGRLGLLTNLADVELGGGVSLENVARLQDAAPRTVFHYSFNLFGKTLSTTDTEVSYKNQQIGNDGEEELRQALAVLDQCERFVLDNCGFDYDVLAAVREDFRDGPRLVWRVYFGVDSRYNSLTDDEMIRAVYNVTDDDVGPLRYCEGARYIDMGHNEYLTDFSFMGYMPELEVFIGSGSAIQELPATVANCKKLTWLELAECRDLSNIDGLEGCESLRFLNISYSKVTSLMALDSLPLERFVYLNPRASVQEQNTFTALHKDSGCRIVYYGYSNPWTPWRYDDNGKTRNYYYNDVVRVAFNYDYLEQFLPKN